MAEVVSPVPGAGRREPGEVGRARGPPVADPGAALSPQGEIIEGCRLPVLRRNQDNEDEWPLAEILSVKDISGRKLFYVHYIDCESWAWMKWGCWKGLRAASGIPS